MSSQDQIPQTATTMEAAFTLHEDPALQAEFWRHQMRMGPIAAAFPGFISVIGGQIHRTHWLYFCGKWTTPALMNEWQFDIKHTPMQDAAHSRWFSSVYIRKWRRPDADEAMTSSPLFCEIAIARSEPLDPATIDHILDTIIGPSLDQHDPMPFETLTGQFEERPYQFVGPLQEFPALAPARYLLVTHWRSDTALQTWLRSGVLAQLAAYGETISTVSVPIKHLPDERNYLRADGMQRDAVHA